MRKEKIMLKYNKGGETIMVSITKTDVKNSKTIIGELAGLSTDTKPTKIDGNEVGNGCKFLEIDTGKIYIFDEQNKQWKEFA